jgi:hypothetical protein
MTVGQVLEKSEDELLALRNFGRKSYEELKDKLIEMGFLSEAAMEEIEVEFEVPEEDIEEAPEEIVPPARPKREAKPKAKADTGVESTAEAPTGAVEEELGSLGAKLAQALRKAGQQESPPAGEEVEEEDQQA